MGFSRQEYWSVLPFSSPRALPDPGIEPESPALAGRFFTTEQQGSPVFKWASTKPWHVFVHGMFPSSAWQLEKDMNGTSFRFFSWITSPSWRELLGPDLPVQKCICVCGLAW